MQAGANLRPYIHPNKYPDFNADPNSFDDAQPNENPKTDRHSILHPQCFL